MKRKYIFIVIPVLLMTSYMILVPLMYGVLAKGKFGHQLIDSLWREEMTSIEQYPITFITAFINIGPVQKAGNAIRGQDVYYNWMKLYGRFNAPLVVYTNDPVFLLEAKAIRENFTSITKFILIEDMYKLPGFKHFKETERLFSDPEYPKIFGVTTNPKYTSVMHSKYDFVEMTIEQNYFGTPYFAWTDIGSLRNMGKSSEILNVRVPPQFNDSRIAFNKIFDHYPEQTIKYVMTSFSMWVAGGFFLGRPSVMLKYINQYRKFVDKLMAMNLMSTDESILFAMYTKEGYTPDMVDLQLYYGKGDACDYWFHLMYLITNHYCLGNNTI